MTTAEELAFAFFLLADECEACGGTPLDRSRLGRGGYVLFDEERPVLLCRSCSSTSSGEVRRMVLDRRRARLEPHRRDE